MIQERSELPVVKLRPLAFTDLDEFLEIRNAVADMLHDNSKFSLSECRDWFATTKIRYYVVESEGIGILGYFRVNSYETQDDKIEIGLDLSPKYQGRKWSKALYKIFTEDILVPQGINFISLRVLKKNFKAMNLYLDLGFKVTDETELDRGMEVRLRDLLLEFSNSPVAQNLVSE